MVVARDNLIFDVHDEDDPNGAALARITSQAKGKFYRLERNGTGSGGLAMALSRSQIQYLKKNRLVRVYYPPTSPTEPIGSFFLQKRSSLILTKRGRGARQVAWTGGGALSYLARVRLPAITYLEPGGMGPLEGDGTWRWHLQGSWIGAVPHSLGAFFYRSLLECTDPDRPQQPLADLTIDFDASLDSNGNPWTPYEGEAVSRIGDSELDTALMFMKLGLWVEMSHDLVLRAYDTPQGRDLTGAAWGANVVRFQAPTGRIVETGNIKDELTSTGDSEIELSHELVFNGEAWSYVANPAGGDVVREGFLQVDASDPTSQQVAAEADMAGRDRAADTIRLRIRHGNDEAKGLYLFGTRGHAAAHAAPGDLATLNAATTAEGGYEEYDQEIAAVTWTDRARGPATDVVIDFGAAYRTAEDRQGHGDGCSCPPGLRLCDTAIACVDLHGDLLTAQSATNGDAENAAGGQWSGGAYQTTRFHSGARGYGVLSGSSVDFAYTFDPAQVFVAGTRYVLDVWNSQGRLHLTGSVYFGMAGGDDEIVVIDDLPVLETAIGADGATWAHRRVCWTPTANRTGVRFRWQATQDTGGPDWYMLDDLSLATANDELAGTVARAARCDHRHRAQDVSFAPAASGLAATNVQAMGDELAALIAALPGTATDLGWFIVTDPAYGAVGDDTADDTAAIQAAWDAAVAAGGGIVYFPNPAPKYKITGALNLVAPSGVRVLLLGMNPGSWSGPCIIRQATANTTALNFNDLDVDNSAIVGITIEGPGGTQTSGDGIFSLKTISLRNVHVSGFFNGLRLGGQAYYSKLYESMFYDNDNAGVLVADGNNNIDLYGCRFHSNLIGLQVDGCLKLGVHGGSIETSGSYGIRIDNTGGNQTGGIVISGVYFELNTTADIRIGHSSTVFGSVIQGSFFLDGPTYHIDAQHVNGLVIEGNDFLNTGTTVRTQAPAAGVVLIGNRNAGSYALSGNARIIDPETDTAPSSVGSANSAGTSRFYPRLDHVHAIGGAAGGDLAGTYPNPSVVDDSHSHTTATAPGGSGGGLGPLLLASDHATPIVFDDILQASDGSDFLYASEP
jgi:hypothetical protein